MIMRIVTEREKSVHFDAELPTAKDVLVAICSVASQYAVNPSLELAELASSLSRKLTAPEYADSEYLAEIANRLVKQWDQVMQEYLYVQSQLMGPNTTLQ